MSEQRPAAQVTAGPVTLNIRRPHPRATSPYEIALWVSIGLFIASVLLAAASVMFMLGWAPFGGGVVLMLGFGVLAKLCQETHLNNQLAVVTQPPFGDDEDEDWEVGEE